MYGTPVGGAPPGPLEPPPGAPGVLEVWKKLQKFPTNILKNYMHQNTPNYDSNTHFVVLGLPWGAWGGQNLQGGW